MFVILTGSSGVGKNTVIKNLIEEDNKFVLMPTYTTRQKREGEIEGNPYFYLTKEEFQDKIKHNDFIEYELIHTNFYGSSLSIFEDYLKKGKIILKDIGVEGAQNLKIKLAGKTEIIKLFLTTKSKRDLKNRLKGRKEKQIKLRLKRYSYEQKQKNKFDYIIINQNLDVTIDTINKVISLKNDDFLPYKNTKRISKYFVKYYMNKLQAGKILKPIKIALKGEKAYIISGVEKFIASILTQKPVAKLIVNKEIKKIVSVDKDWFKKVL